MMVCPRATNFPVLRANVPPLFSPRMLEVSASFALGELEQLLQRLTVCIGPDPVDPPWRRLLQDFGSGGDPC